MQKLAVAFILCLSTAFPQATEFDVRLLMDTQSAQQTLELYLGRGGVPSSIASLRGSQLALATTSALTQRRLTTEVLGKHLEALKFNQADEEDIFLMRKTRPYAREMSDLLQALTSRSFGQKVASTVQQLFPPGTRVSATVPFYVVAFGPANVDAYVQRIVWRDGTPTFVREGKGELTIVLNLARALFYGDNVDERFYWTLSVVAHEVFHAAFGAYKDKSSYWRSFYATRHRPFDQLIDIAQNEGIAYYLTLIQRSRAVISQADVPRVLSMVTEFNAKSAELFSSRTSPTRINDILRQANTSGYWENFGAITGMIMARSIDNKLGRSALMETISNGPDDFFGKYIDLTQKHDDLPKLSDSIVRYFGR